MDQISALIEKEYMKEREGKPSSIATTTATSSMRKY